MASSNRNQIIDGWRGVSVILVLAGHAIGYRIGVDVEPIKNVLHSPADLFLNLLLRVAGSLGEVGVEFFFVISGYLITSLLFSEERKRGKISFKAFYVRRIFRISPAFYVYIIAVLCLTVWGPLVAKPEAFVRSSLYICNVSGFSCSWWLAHTWSLSVEEQFYLCWPILFALLGTRRKTGIAIIATALIIGSAWLDILLPFAHIAIGAAVALINSLKELITRLSSKGIVAVMAIILLVKPLTFPVPMISNLVFILQPILVSFILFGTLYNPSCSRFRIFLSNKALVKVGLVSYSLYLWQQLSLAPNDWGGRSTGASGLYADYPVLTSLMFIPIAVISYNFLELPLIRYGHNISNKLLGERPPNLLT